MWFTVLAPILATIFGEKGPIGQYLKIKSDIVAAENNYKLAALQAESERIKAEVVADTEQRSNYLGATSRGFRQGIFYWFSAIIAYSIIYPSGAEAMWMNFDKIPEWVRYAYLGMVSVAWGLPVAKEHVGLMFASITRGIQSRREYKLEKARLNRDAVHGRIREKWFPKGMSEQQAKDLDGAIDEGEKFAGQEI